MIKDPHGYIDQTVRLAVRADEQWGLMARAFREPILARLNSLGTTAQDLRDAAEMLEHAATQLRNAAEKAEADPNRLREKQIGDTLYTFTPQFREGAWDLWSGVPYTCNPYRDGSQRAQDWEDGHTLADEGEVTREEVGPRPDGAPAQRKKPRARR